MKSNTFRLFVVSGIIVFGSFLVATFWDALQLGNNKIPLAMALIVAFGFSIAGLIVGFGEMKQVRNPKMWVGLIGHSIVVGFVILMMVYAALT